MTNAELNILVRVRAAEAQRQIAQLQSRLALMETQTRRSSAASNVPWFASMSAAGSRLQWIGRQITANLSGPILIAGGLLVKSAMEQEKAVARLAKLYGDDATMATGQLNSEITALGKTFTALSSKFGVNRAEITNVAADWAAAGSSGLALAKSVELTMRTMVVGEMDAAEATQALISIQAQYNQDTNALTDTIYRLNSAENVSGATLKGLVTGFAKAAGSARSAGVDVNHLAAMLAALTPAAGSAAEAGNALKTIISRIMSPTGEAADVLNEMKINLDDVSWKSLNAAQRMELMAKKFELLDPATRPVVSALVASRWQISRFDVAMREMASGTGYYARVLEELANPAKVLATAQKELNTVLGTSSSKMAQAGQTIKNSLTDAIFPLLPALAAFSLWVAKISRGFQELDPHVQKLIGIAVLLLAVFGPVLTMLGLMKLAIGQLAPMFIWLAKVALLPLAPFKLLGAALLLPFTGTAKLIAALVVSRTAFAGASIAGLAYAGALKAIAATQFVLITAIKATVIAIRAAALAWMLFPVAMAMARVAMIAIWASLGPALLAIDVVRTVAMLAIQRAFTAAWLATAYAAWVTYNTLQQTMWRLQAALVHAWNVAIVAIQLGFNYIRLAAERTFWMAYFALQAAMQAISLTMTRTFWAGYFALQAAMHTASLALTRAYWVAHSALHTAGMAAALVATKVGGALLVIAHAAWQMMTLNNLKKWAIAFVTLTSGALTGALAILKRFALGIVSLLVSPWALAIGAIIAILIYFKDQIARAIGNVINYFKNMPQGIKDGLAPITNVFAAMGRGIMNAFNALPDSVKNVLLKLVSIVRAAAMKIYELFSYINPFARHSPSLVENVTAGMAAIGNQFGLAERDIAGSVAGIYASITKMGEAARGLTDANAAAAHDDTMSKLAKAAPEAIDAYVELGDKVRALKGDLDAVSNAISQQEAVVDNLKSAVEAADAGIDAMNDTLDALKASADAVGDMLDKAKERMEYFANAQIQGMEAASDATFENSMRQKQLQLEIARLEKSAGTIDDLADSYAKLQGQIETLQGKKLELQFAGAGSDITGPYDAMIASLKAQQDALSQGASGPAAEMDNLKTQLQELQDQASIMDLENSLKFDPLNRQLEKMKSNIVELPFGQIVAGYTSSSAAVDGFTLAQEAANLAVSMQEKLITAAEAARDGLSAQYDTENEKLTTLKNAYDDIETSIRDGEQALNDMTAAAEQSIARMEAAQQQMLNGIKLGLGPDATAEAIEAAQAAKDIEDAYKSLEESRKAAEEGELSPGLQNFRDSIGGDFADPGGKDVVTREGGLGDQSADIDAYTQNLTDQLGTAWGGLDPFKPLKDAWNNAWKWMADNFGSTVAPLKTMFSDIGTGISEGFAGGEGELTRFQQLIENIRNAFSNTWDFLKGLGGTLAELFGPDLRTTINEVKEGFEGIWATIGPKLKELGDNLQPLWDFLKVAAAVLIPVLLGIVEVVWEMVNGAIGPIMDFIGDIIGAIIEIVQGVIRVIGGIAQIIMGLFTLDGPKIWEGIQNVIGGILDIIGGLFGAIISLFKNGGLLVWNVIWGFIKGIIDFFFQLYDELVGHSIVPDMINGIIDWFIKLPGRVLDLIGSMIGAIIDFFLSLPTKIYDALVGVSTMLMDLFRTAFWALVENGPDMIKGFLDFIFEIPRKILNALGLPGDMLVQFGKDMIMGLLEGAGSLLSKIGEFFMDKLPGWIKEPFKKAMGIESPSKVFAEYGVNTGEGYVQGLESQMTAVEAAAQSLANGAANVTVPELPAVTAAAPTPAVANGAGAGDVATAMAANTAAATATWEAYVASMDASMVAWAARQGEIFTALSGSLNKTHADMFVDMQSTTDAGIEGMYAKVYDGTGLMLESFEWFRSSSNTTISTLSTELLAAITTMVDSIVILFTNMKDDLILQMTDTKDGTTLAFQGMADGLKSVFDQSIKPVFDSFGPMLKLMEENFTETVANVGTIWDDMKEKTAVPARFIIDKVYNSGIKEAWNQVNGFLGVPALKDFVAGFAEGGYTGPGGKYKPAGIVHGDEFVIQKSARRAFEATNPGALDHLNKYGNLPGYADGGPVKSDAPPWPGGGGESNLKPAAILARRNIHMYWPQIQTIGGYRAQDAYPDHPSGLALDIMTGDPVGTQVNNWLHQNMNPLALNYTIWKQFYKPAGGAGNLMEDRGSATQNHYDHVHALFNANGVPGIQDGGVGGGAGSISFVQQVEEIFSRVMDPIKALAPGVPGSGTVGDFPEKGFDKFHDDVKAFLVGKATELDMQRTSFNPGGAGVERWRSTVEEVLRVQGRAIGLTDITLAQMQSESGGNPQALNDWDSNWAAGTPSKGLMQVTDPTFSDFKDLRFANDIWDPKANIAAGLNQVHARYGGPQGVWGQGHGYDNGGYLEPGIVGNFTGAKEPVLTTNQWGAMYTIASSAGKFTWQTIQKGVLAANQEFYGTDPAKAQAVATGQELVKANDTWVPDFYDASQAQVDSAKATTTAAKATTKGVDKFIDVGTKIKTAVDGVSAVMLALAAAMQDPNSFGAWAPVIDATAELIEKLPDVKAEYVPWAGTAQTVTEDMKRQKAANDVANLAKGGYMFFKQVAPALLRATSAIGTAIESLITQDGAAWTTAIGILATGNPMGAVMLIPLILKAIFTILPAILQAIMDIVPALISAIIMFITQFMPDSVYAYDTYDSANQAVQENEGAIKQGASAPYFVPPAQNSGNSNAPVTVHVYEVNVSADSPDSAEQFVSNLTTLG